MLQIRLRRAKADPFGKGVNVFLGKTESQLCPVRALLSFLSVRPQTSQEAPLFVNKKGAPLTKEAFVKRIRAALARAGIDQSAYSGHSFRIGAASVAAARNVPAHTIKMLGRWSSEAYMLYIRQSRANLAAVSPLLAGPAGPTNSTYS